VYRLIFNEFEKQNIMDLENKVKQQLLSRGFTKEQLLNHRGLIGAVIDEVALMIVKNLAMHDVNNCVDLKHELEVTDKLLNERQRVLDAIPECPSHGKCVPYAIEWIDEMKAKHCC
jgi:hypothetical protein